MSDLGINPFKDTNSESTGFTSTRLGLSDCVFPFDDGQDGFLLDLRWLLVPITEDSSEKVRIQFEFFKTVDNNLPIGLHVFARDDFLFSSLSVSLLISSFSLALSSFLTSLTGLAVSLGLSLFEVLSFLDLIIGLLNLVSWTLRSIKIFGCFVSGVLHLLYKQGVWL